jgi:hypothetical protein
MKLIVMFVFFLAPPLHSFSFRRAGCVRKSQLTSSRKQTWRHGFACMSAGKCLGTTPARNYQEPASGKVVLQSEQRPVDDPKESWGASVSLLRLKVGSCAFLP